MVETSRLRWLCRRGMKELDELLEGFFEARFEGLSPARRKAFARLLELQDPELLAYLMDRERPKDEGLRDVIREIRRNAGLQS
ncbi:MAG TPA: succinate dehydrogenase assembly factor 2 [Gammaproteobacteria bacterium]|nr:succinate dehydrogenase assembly factor 2 [Gammaproteobacteria bacterium]